MMELLITIVLFLLLILVVIWLPFLKQTTPAHTNKKTSNVRDETNVQLYHEHKKEIEKDYQQGSIDEENYQYLLAELDKSLLQDIDVNKNAAQDFDPSNNKIAIIWPSIITVFVLVFSFTVYMQTGAYDKLSQDKPTQAVDAHQQMSAADQQMFARIQQLKQLTTAEPENGDAWYSLGQAYVSAGDFDSAIKSFDQVITIEGEKADVMGAKAQAYYYQNNQQINAQVQVFIDKALALDPNEPSTNILLGMHSFLNENYQQAITYWQGVIKHADSNVNVAGLQQAITEAKNRLAQASGAMPNKNTGPANNAQSTLSEKSGPQLTLSVKLSEEILALLSQGADKTVFIYATPTDGQRMPLAAVKVNASALPLTIVLNDAKAMTPQAKLSNVKSAHIYAVISQLGSVGIKSGDFKAEQLNVPTSTKEVIELTIDTVVP